MKELIHRLIQLQEIDSRILAKRHFIDAVPNRVSEVDEPFKKAKTELDAVRQKTEALLKKKKDKESQLDEVNAKIAKMRSRLSEIKTNKEYQAHLKEIESSEKEISSVEDQILVAMEELDTNQRLQKEQEKKVAAETAKIDAFKKELEQEVATYEKELLDLKQERSALAASIDPEAYALYKRLMQIEHNHGVAVVRARNEICAGCDMNIPPQLFVELRKNEELIQCPQCGRILFYREDPA